MLFSKLETDFERAKNCLFCQLCHLQLKNKNEPNGRFLWIIPSFFNLSKELVISSWLNDTIDVDFERVDFALSLIVSQKPEQL
jgi:hypothetical protein